MPITCPNCGSRNLRYSRFRSFSERGWSWLGIRPLRCRDCRLRFIDRTWQLSDLRFARCPRCWRMDLALWNPKDAHISMFMAIRLGLGAKPYRCEYCRVNFVSFRARHERFSYRRWAKMKKGIKRKAPSQQSIKPE
jgi:predicted Zn-ribbon and HTH transcriptional regulator